MTSLILPHHRYSMHMVVVQCTLSVFKSKLYHTTLRQLFDMLCTTYKTLDKTLAQYTTSVHCVLHSMLLMPTRC